MKGSEGLMQLIHLPKKTPAGALYVSTRVKKWIWHALLGPFGNYLGILRSGDRCNGLWGRWRGWGWWSAHSRHRVGIHIIVTPITPQVWKLWAAIDSTGALRRGNQPIVVIVIQDTAIWNLTIKSLQGNEFVSGVNLDTKKIINSYKRKNREDCDKSYLECKVLVPESMEVLESLFSRLSLL